MTTVYVKDPDAVLDYVFDWAGVTNGSDNAKVDWLSSGETITTHTVTVSAGLTKDSDELINSNTSVRAWLSGGTAGIDYTVTCRVTTNQGRTDDRTITVSVLER